MTTATAATPPGWLDEGDYPSSPQPRDLLEFFGIPPSPPENLDENIRLKRKHWKKRRNKGRSDEMLELADAVLQAIADAEDALKRGSTAASGGAEPDFGAGPARTREPSTIDEVWRELERLLFRGRYADALTRVRDYEGRWGTYPAFVDVRSWVILEAAQNGQAVEPDLLTSAIDGARSAIGQLGPSEARFLTLIDLLELAGRRDEVRQTVSDAMTALGTDSPAFYLKQLQLDFAKQPYVQLLRRCVGLVDQWPDDRALRSDLVQAIIARAAADLLPISNPSNLSQYRLLVSTAAWIAEGVPEAEDFVRMHRMWAANADQPIFGGNWQWRAFFGLITFFIALPFINKATAKPAYQVLLDGPALGDTSKRLRNQTLSRNRAWFLVTRNAYVEPVHAHSQLPWQSGPNHWPEVDSSPLFTFAE